MIIIKKLLNLKLDYVFKRIFGHVGNEQIKKAKNVLEEISQEDRERYLAKLRQKYIMDQKAIEGDGYD